MHRSLATCSRLCQRLSWSLRVTATASGFISIFCGRSRRTPSFVMPHADSIQGPSRVALRRVSVVPIPSGGRGYQWGIIIAILLVSSLQLGYMFMSGDRLGTAQPQSGPEIARAASPTRNDRLQQQHTDVKSTTGATKIKIGISKRRTEVLAPGDEEASSSTLQANLTELSKLITMEALSGAADRHSLGVVSLANDLLLEAQDNINRLKKELATCVNRTATAGVGPPTEWPGPADMDMVVTARVNEMEMEWKRRGSPAEQRPGIRISNWEASLPWPFQRLKALVGSKDTGVVALCAPLSDEYYRRQMERSTFWRLKANGHIMIGIASYMHFPGEIHNPANHRHVGRDLDIMEAMDGWLHCFWEPERYIPYGLPRMLMSESDFYEPTRNDSDGVLVPKKLPKKYDFLYVNGGGAWNDYNRNWTLAHDAIVMFARDLNLTTLIVGHSLVEYPEMAPYIDQGLIIPSQKLKWRDFLDELESARALFVPNVHDASPRVVAEGFCRDVPVLMNWHIAGGWKYVNDRTGVFFHDLSDIRQAVSFLRATAHEFSPRAFYSETFGRSRSSARLHAFLDLVAGPKWMAAAANLSQQH